MGFSRQKFGSFDLFRVVRCMFLFCHSFIRVRYRKIFSIAPSFYILISVFLLSGCSYFISSATVDMTENLSQAILNNNDLATVEDGGPAYLLMVDSFLYRNPDNESLLRGASNIYTAYTTVFVKDKARAKKLTEKALSYALRAICIRRSKTCRFREVNFQEFKNTILS